MATVTYNGESFECAKVVKGTVGTCGLNFLHLLDANGNLLHAFDHIRDFSAFSIPEGAVSTLRPDSCYLAVVGDDGRVYKSTLFRKDVATLSDAVPVAESFTYTLSDEGSWVTGSLGNRYYIYYRTNMKDPTTNKYTNQIVMQFDASYAIRQLPEIWIDFPREDSDMGAVYVRVTDIRVLEDQGEVVKLMFNFPWPDDFYTNVSLMGREFKFRLCGFLK